MKNPVLIVALLALCSTTAFAAGEGEGNSATDRGKTQSVACVGNQMAVPVPGPDGIIIWNCTAPGADERADKSDANHADKYRPAECHERSVTWNCQP